MPKQMSREERAAYMRNYRARRKAARIVAELGPAFEAVRAEMAAYETDPGRRAVEAAGVRLMLGLPFLHAPNDDCSACGHDRQTFHTAGPCTAPNGRRRCSCPDFVPVLFDD